MVACLDRLFDDKRVCVGVLMVWLVVVVCAFKDIGLLESKFMSFGPTPKTLFMDLVLDTWYKWGLVAVFTFCNTTINDFMSDAIGPWLLNTITDHKTKYIPYTKMTCLAISQGWSVYCAVMGLIGLFISISQVDFMLIRIVADLNVNTYTTLKFLRHKECNPQRYTGGETCAEMSERMHVPPQDFESGVCTESNVSVLFSVEEEDHATDDENTTLTGVHKNK